MHPRSVLSQPVVLVVAAMLVFANGIVTALPDRAELSDLQKLLVSGAVAVVSWLLTLGIEKALARRRQDPAEPGPGLGAVSAESPASMPALPLWAGVAFLPAAVIGAYWIGAKALAKVWDLFGADLPAAIRDLHPGGAGRSRELMLAVSVLFVIAHGVAAAAMVKVRDRAASWRATGTARTGASIAALGHLAGCVLWATNVASLAMPITAFTVAYAAIMLIVVTGRLFILGSSRPAGFADWLTIACYGLLTPVLQMFEVLSWPLFAAWVGRRWRAARQ